MQEDLFVNLNDFEMFQLLKKLLKSNSQQNMTSCVLYVVAYTDEKVVDIGNNYCRLYASTELLQFSTFFVTL